MYKIIDLLLNDLRINLKKKNINIRVNKTAKKVLLQDGAHREWGARPLRRIIQNQIENPISIKFLNGELIENSSIVINGKADKLIFTINPKKNTKKIKSLTKTIK